LDLLALAGVILVADGACFAAKLEAEKFVFQFIEAAANSLVDFGLGSRSGR
jgi:hypothetical protein